MISHSKSKRGLKNGLPQIESTLPIEQTDAQVICQVADKAFRIGCHYSLVQAGESYWLVKSARRQDRAYLVHQIGHSNVWQCSCGLNCSDHDHIRIARSYKADHETDPRTPETVTEPAAIEPAISEPLTAAQWKEIAKRDKARQKAYYEEYRQNANELREVAGIA